jgi:hypothetical protein
MAKAPEKDRAEVSRRQPEQEKEQRREASGHGRAEEPREEIDPREEEGWTQPESSAQKGALPDES